MTNIGLTEDMDTALLKTLMEQGSEAIIFADREGLIQEWNTGAERIFGHAKADVLGKSLDIIIPERLRDAHWKGFHAALSSGKMKYKDQVMTTKSVHKDGSQLYVDLSFFMVHDTSGAVMGSLSVARDCTARYLKDRELKARVTELEQQSQPQAKS